VGQRASREDREKMMQIISDPATRKKFKADKATRKQTLRQAGVSEGPEVDQLAETLAGMDETELAAIAKANKQMVDLGYTEKGSSILAEAV
jgi:hypothetical protein